MFIRSRGFLILVLVLLAAGAGVLAWLSSRDDGAATPAERLPTLELIEQSSVPFLDFVPGADVAWLDDERLALIDGDLHRLALLRLEDGAIVYAGEEGSGPGQFRSPNALDVTPDGRVLIADPLLVRITEWSEASGFGRTAPVPGAPLGVYALDARRVLVPWAGHGAEGAHIGTIDLSDGAVSNHVALGNVVAGIGVGRAPGEAFPWAISTRCANDAWVVANPWRYELARVTRTGELLGTFGRPELPPEVPSERDLARMDEGIRRALRDKPPELVPILEDALARERTRPKPFLGSLVASDDLLYVVTPRGDGSATIIDVFTCEGEFLGEIRMRDAVSSLAVRGDRLAAVVRRLSDELERHGVDVYEVR